MIFILNEVVIILVIILVTNTFSSKESAAAMVEDASAEPETTWVPGNWMSPSAAGVVGLALAGPAGGAG